MFFVFTIVKLLMAAIFGACLGIDRENKDKPMGIQCYMIVCIATCLIAILSMELRETFLIEDNETTLDIGKIISGSITGVGFLGAGAIIQSGKERVVGVVTGASIWTAGGIGLCIGYGMYALAVTVLALIIFILIYGKRMSDYLHKKGYC